MAAGGEWSGGILEVGGESYRIHRLDAVESEGLGELARLPRSIRVLLENLLRFEDGDTVTREDIAALAAWRSDGSNAAEIAFRPARVLLQDFTGVPAVVDLAAMRDAMASLGGDPSRIEPLRPADMVVDHSVQVDVFGRSDALARNSEIEFRRNRERYEFLRWGQAAFESLRVVPPATGIVHQVNIEHLASVVFSEGDRVSEPVSSSTRGGARVAFPDTLVGTDSHTTMVNGLGVIGWGVGGIEAEACLLGQPISMLIPDVVGFRLVGELPAGATATDLVLTVTEMLRAHGVVGKFVEFFGPGLAGLPLADRATIANMAPEYGATVGFFPIDSKTLEYLNLSGREPGRVALVEAYAREQGLFAEPGDPEPEYTSRLELDLATVVPSLSGPRRPQDRVALSDARLEFSRALDEILGAKEDVDDEARERSARLSLEDQEHEIGHGSVVIAAITSCTNTSNPYVMVAAGLLARNAVQRGLRVKPWVKTSLAPGSRVVSDYLSEAGLLEPLETLGFSVVGYGCTTCIGNSGPLPEPVAAAVRDSDLVVASVLSGNRNFEGRVNPLVRANYLASPPLVVAYALAGGLDVDLVRQPLGADPEGRPVMLSDVWPEAGEVDAVVARAVRREMFEKRYADVFEGDEAWRAIPVPAGNRYAWSAESSYIQHPPFFEGMAREAAPIEDVRGARALALLGDSVTTDHISPAGMIPPESPAGQYLIARGVEPADFNGYGARRGNHEVMLRGTFANIRLRNRLAPGTEGGFTALLPDGEIVTIYAAAQRYAADGVPLIVLAGTEYGTGSSRDWAAKGTRLLGVRAVIAKSFERIHRSNLVGMGVLPLEFLPGEGPDELGLTGRESFDIEGLPDAGPAREIGVRARSDGGESASFGARIRIDTPQEWEYYRHGGILRYVLRQMLD
ncbi:MAG: aconitate hydratase AcnA [Proteobacteria bacterium]|nr:aconitate hydratase AcnA [Pseudomonadota bacterium]